MAPRIAPPTAVAAVGLLTVTPPALAAPQAPNQAALQRQLDQLQQLLKQQQQTIDALQQQVQQLQGQQTQSQQAVQDVNKKVEETRQAVAQQPVVQPGRKNVKLALSGFIDRAVNIAADGKNTKAYFVDNANANSRFRLDGTYEPTKDTTVGATIEVAVRPNNSTQVSQTDENPGDSFDERKVEGYVKNKTLGDLYLGKGDPSAKDITRIDLSDTDLLAYASVGDIAGGLLFAQDDAYTTTDVSSAFTDFDPGRQNRVRYDTPVFAGFTASGTYGANEVYSGALRWTGEGAGFRAAAGVGYSNPNQHEVRQVISGSGSVLNVGTGLSLTFAAGEQNRSGYNPYFYYAKLGWQWDLISLGRTAFSVDYQHTEDRPGQDNSSNSIGLAVVQNLPDWGTELYAGVRGYELAVSGGPDPDNIYVGTVGTRVRF